MDPFWTITVTFRLGNPNGLLLLLITHELLIWTAPSINSNDLEFETGHLVYPIPLASFAIVCGLSDRAKEPNIKYLLTVTRDSWSSHPDIIVKREKAGTKGSI